MKTLKRITFLLLLLSSGWLCAQQDIAKNTISGDQQQRLDLMKLKGVEASLTILPVRIMEQNWDRVSEIIGLLLEQKGLKSIEIGNNIYFRKSKLGIKDLADSLKIAVTKYPQTTDYTLYVEMNGDKEPPPVDELVGILVDNKGELVWSDYLNSQDEVFNNVDDPDPMGYSILLTQRLAPYFNLDAETTRDSKPGKMAAKMRERSGLPPEEEMNAMPERKEVLKSRLKESTLVIFPVRTMGVANSDGSEKLVALINDKGLSKARMSKNPALLKTSQNEPNEMKVLWDLAKDFRSYLVENPEEGDYFLYADYAWLPNQGQAGYVHFIICDSKGEWVIADLQNSNQGDFRQIAPATLEGCNQLVYTRLLKYSKLSITDKIRETIGSSGIEAAVAKFRELSPKEEYLLSEEEMNMLGYEYLQAEKYDEAIAVFKMNVEAFPDSFNTYDSLGEAYAAKGEKELAIKNYEMSVKLNPDNQNGVQMLKKLKGN
ncbi:MAG TPA: hypothetical protein VK212_01660 [Lentimicrobium sp.]|nr:hypothetical protein [Lentimicrobium sp.]